MINTTSSQTQMEETAIDINRSNDIIQKLTIPANLSQINIEQKDIPDQVEKQFPGGICNLVRKQYSIKIKLHFFSTKNSNPDSIEELVSKQQEAVDIKLIITNKWMPKELKSAFRTASHLYNYLAINIGDSNKVVITRQNLKLIIDQKKQIVYSYQEAAQFERAKNNYLINLENIEDKLLQFNSKQWKLLDTMTKLYLNEGRSIQNEEQRQKQKNGTIPQKQQLSEEDQQLVQKYAQYVLANQQQDFLQDFDQPQWFDQDSELINRLTAEQNLIKQFENKYAHTLKQFTTITAPPTPAIPFRNNYQSQDRMSTVSSSTIPPGPAPFPPGYTPPHLVKPIAADGFAPEEHLRLTANQTKKEKLRMSKQMLKMGYSTDQVIQRLEEIERAHKSGKVDPRNVFSAPSKGPIRPFHIPRQQRQQRQSRQHRPLSYTPQLTHSQPSIPNNDRVVREMLISLLKQKRYKKLQDIQRHMENEGVITTVQNLKRMIDEIRARNAQRKAQNEQAQNKE